MLVVVAPAAAVLPRTVSAVTRYSAQSLAFQLPAGEAAYSASMAPTYPLNSSVTWRGGRG